MSFSLSKQSRVHLIGLIVCLSLFGDLTLFAVLPTHFADAGLTLATIGIMLSIHRLVRVPGNPIAGMLMDRWGRKRFLVAGMVLAVLATTAYGLVEGFVPFLLARIAWGMAWMFINISGMALIIDLSDGYQRGKFSGNYNTWVMIGLASGPLLGGFLVDLVGFQVTMRLGGLITFIGLLLAIFMVPKRQSEPNSAEKVRAAGIFVPSFRLLKSLRTEIWVIFILFAIVLFTGEGVALSTLSLRAQELFGSAFQLGDWQLGIATVGGILLGYRSLAAALSSPLFGHLSDGKLQRFGVVLISLLAGALGFYLLGSASNILWMLVGLTLSAFSAGSIMAVLIAWLGDLTEESQRGSVMGLYATFGDLGSMSGPLVAYQLMNRISLQVIYLLCASVFLLGAVLLWISKVRLTRRHESNDRDLILENE